MNLGERVIFPAIILSSNVGTPNLKLFLLSFLKQFIKALEVECRELESGWTHKAMLVLTFVQSSLVVNYERCLYLCQFI